MQQPDIRIATAQDLAYLVHLSKKHAEELGFLTTQAIEAYTQRGNVALARENGDPIGYFLHSTPRHETRIFQACVQMDARNLGHAQNMLSRLIKRCTAHAGRRITLHCRDGLAANGFWSACGFRPLELYRGGAARRRIIITWELDIAAALSNPSLPYAAAFLAQHHQDTEAGTCTHASGRLTPTP